MTLKKKYRFQFIGDIGIYVFIQIVSAAVLKNILENRFTVTAELKQSMVKHAKVGLWATISYRKSIHPYSILTDNSCKR